MPGHLRCTICHLAHSTPQRRESLYFVTKNFDPALYFSKTLTLRCISQKTFTLVCVSQKLWPYSLDLSNPGLYFPKTLTLVCVSQISHIMIFCAWSTSFKVRFNWSGRHIVWQTCFQEDSLSWEVRLQQLPNAMIHFRSSSGLMDWWSLCSKLLWLSKTARSLSGLKKLSVAWNCSRLPSCDVVGCHRGAIVVPPLPSPRWPPMPSPLPQTSKQRF